MIDSILADIEIASIFAIQHYIETDRKPRSETSPLTEFTSQDIHNNHASLFMPISMSSIKLSCSLPTNVNNAFLSKYDVSICSSTT